MAGSIHNQKDIKEEMAEAVDDMVIDNLEESCLDSSNSEDEENDPIMSLIRSFMHHPSALAQLLTTIRDQNLTIQKQNKTIARLDMRSHWE